MKKLNKVAEGKIKKYSNGQNNIVPFVLSSGGMLHSTAASVLKNLNKKGGDAGKFLIQLSIELIRKRAECSSYLAY